MEQGDVARAAGRLREARSAYREAAALDPQLSRAQDALASIGQEIVQADFRAQMSRAFSAMEQGDFDGARAAFDAAEKILPGDPAVARGRAQVSNREARNSVSQAMARAAQYEAEEQWAEARQVYESLLGEDSTLTVARARLVPVTVRAELDARFESFFEDPLKLANRPQYEAAQQTLADARQIAGPGPKLQAQIEELETLLKRAVTPVDVVFQSDSQTHVTLFRVAELGTFDRTSLTLRPGRYIAAGTRRGYRDVRVEFTVTGEPMEGPVVVRCEEPI